MVTIHNCKCGLKWQIETHVSGGSYRGRLECGICKRVIASWEDLFYYTVKRAAGEEEPSKASAAERGLSYCTQIPDFSKFLTEAYQTLRDSKLKGVNL